MSVEMNRLNQMDRAMVRFMGSYAISLLRIALAVTYIWFGALKISGKSPVAELVAKTVFFLPKKIRVLFMGFWEVLIGIGLLLRFPLRLTLLLMNVQLMGTFLVLILQPRRAFQKMNPLLLTETGEFVIKNIVLLSAGIAVGSTVRRDSERIHDEQGRVAR